MRRFAAWYLSLAAVAAAAAVWQAGLSPGLTARYYAGVEAGGVPRLRTVEPRIASQPIRARSQALFGSRPFSATFDGVVHVDRPGDYRFRLASGGVAGLVVDGRPLVAGGLDGRQAAAEGRVALEAGLHALQVRYVHHGGPVALDLHWRRAADPAPMAPIPAGRLFTSRAAFHLHALPEGVVLPLLLPAFALAACGYRLLRHVARHVQARPAEAGANRALAAVLAGSAGLTLVGIEWGLGLPDVQEWTSDELTPLRVLAARNELDGGWAIGYPLLHFYVLGALLAPFELLGRLGVVNPWAADSYAAMYLLMRAVSVLMAVATVHVVYLCGLELYRDRAAGLWSALLVATMPTFVYYGKTANVDVPYVFWFALSLLYYLRYLRHGRTASLVAFAAAGMLAVCTKDQAYGFYVLPAAHLVWLRARAAGTAILLDRQLALAALAAAAVFVLGQGIVPTPSRFVAHVREIVGPVSDYARHEASLGGYAGLAAETVGLLGRMLTWPGLALCAAGLGVAIRRREAALWAALPALSYYVFLVAAVRYQFDRFLLGIAVVLALFGGRLLAGLLERGPRRLAALGGAALAGYWLLHASLVDVAMLRDSRYRVEAWTRAHVDADARVALAGPGGALPRPPETGGQAILVDEDWTAIERLQPDYVVVNAGRRCRFEPGSGRAAFHAGIRTRESGYLRVLRERTRSPLGALAPELFVDACQSDSTNLGKINSPIEVYRRLGAAGPDR